MPRLMCSLRIFSGCFAATSSMSIPPAALAITTGSAAARSIRMLKRQLAVDLQPSSTSTRLTFLPSGPV